MNKKDTYEFIKRNPGCNFWDLVNHFHATRTAAKEMVASLKKIGVIRSEAQKIRTQPHTLWVIADYTPKNRADKPRQEAVAFIQKHPGVRIADIAAHIGMHRDTARLHLIALEKAGEIAKVRSNKQGRGAGYYIAGTEPSAKTNEERILAALDIPRSVMEISEVTGISPESIGSRLSKLVAIDCDVEFLGDGRYRRRNLERLMVMNAWDKNLEEKARTLNALTARL